MSVSDMPAVLDLIRGQRHDDQLFWFFNARRLQRNGDRLGLSPLAVARDDTSGVLQIFTRRFTVHQADRTTV